MNGGINPNFGLFELPDGQHPELHSSANGPIIDTNEKNSALKYALDEIKIGSWDSIALAVSMLRLKNIALPLLNDLLKLYEETPGVNRDKTFYEKTERLKAQVIAKIEEILSKK